MVSEAEHVCGASPHGVEVVVNGAALEGVVAATAWRRRVREGGWKGGWISGGDTDTEDTADENGLQHIRGVAPYSTALITMLIRHAVLVILLLLTCTRTPHTGQTGSGNPCSSDPRQTAARSRVVVPPCPGPVRPQQGAARTDTTGCCSTRYTHVLSFLSHAPGHNCSLDVAFLLLEVL